MHKLYNRIMHPVIEALAEPIKEARVKHIPKGQIIFYEDDQPQEICLIKSGVVKVYNINSDGNEKILHLLASPSLLPLNFFDIEVKPIRWFYAALMDCELWMFNRHTLRASLETNITSTFQLMSWFSNEVHELLVRLNSLGKSSVGDKLTAALLFLAVRHSRQRPSGWRRVLFPVNHQLLADMIGMTRESTAMAMKDFADRGLVRNPRQTILEIDFNKLCAVAEAKGD